MKHKPEKQAAKLRKFVALYQDSPKMAQKVEQARRELVGLERLARARTIKRCLTVGVFTANFAC